jgi:AcrR family transcriptional regulator
MRQLCVTGQMSINAMNAMRDMSDTEHWPGFDRKKSAEMLAGDGTIDRRARRTRHLLHETLMRLTVERGYDEITVADIAEAADVGRSTFYSHFTDKDALLRSAAGMLRTELLKEHSAAAATTGHDHGRALGFIRFMTEHMQEQRLLYRAMMRGRGGPILLELVRQSVCDVLREELSRGPNAPKDLELSVQFLAGAFMSVLTWWLDRGAKERPQAIEDAFRRLALQGLEGTDHQSVRS